MDFRGRVWKMTFFGLKQGQDLENRAAHPYQEFPGVPPEIVRLLMDHENSLLPFYVCGVVLFVCFAVAFFSKTL